MNFENLDLKNQRCFGWTPSGENGKQSGWTDLAEKAADTGWNEMISMSIQRKLAKDVERSYFNICDFRLKDLDTEMKWRLRFVNDKSLWLLTIDGQDEIEVLEEDRKTFFKSEMFHTIARRTVDYLNRAKKMYDKIIEDHAEAGEMLQVDEVKLGAIMFWIGSKEFTENLLGGKFTR